MICSTKVTFLYKESALNYVSEIIFNVKRSIHKKENYHCPTELLKFGEYYIHFNMNPNTTWYFVFERRETRYLITYAFNNYSTEVKYLTYKN